MSRKASAPLRENPHADVPRDRAVAYDRDGQPLYRRVTGQGDKYAIDPRIVEKGWVYEWKRSTVFNQPDPGYEAELAQNGWRAVPAERHPGIFMGAGATGPVIRDGLILMERPAALNEEERAMSLRSAQDAVRNVKRQHGLGIGDAEGRTKLITNKNVSFVNEQGVTVTGIEDDI